MRDLLKLPRALAILSLVTASTIPPQQQPLTPGAVFPKHEPLPLLIWHGLGDRYDNDGLQSVGTLAEEVHPGTYTYFVRINEDGQEDSKATFWGNVSAQIDQVCEDIHNNDKLHTKDGDIRVDALGFSQGGQFLRGLVQRCDGLNVRSLVTFGSQHNGIAKFKACGTWDFLCKGAIALAKSNAWTDYVQSNVVPAQYYRTLNESITDELVPSDEYLEHSSFLADVNNEREAKTEVYRQRLGKLEKFVMFLFEEDTTVIPRESGWFAEVNGTDGKVQELREGRLYKEDWLGLKGLDEKGALVFKTTPGDHMQLDEDVIVETFEEFFGPERSLLGEAVDRILESVDAVKQYL